MERQLPVRILTWRARRAARTGRGALVCLVIVLLVAGGVGVSRLNPGTGTYVSTCMPYSLTLPRAWRVQPVPMPDCGAPVLFDEYHLYTQGEQLTLSMQAVTLQGGAYVQLIGLSQSAGSVTRHGGGGQVYASLVQRQNGVTTADASFTRPPLNFLMTVESDGRVDPEPVLITAMKGWGDRPSPD